MAGPAVNYYLGLKRGDGNNIDTVLQVSSANAGPGSGTASDVEVRIQINDGSNNTGITRQDAVTRLLTIINFIESQNPSGAGAFLPAS